VENGEFKVAQYCQWDGYLEGQGQDVVKFLTSHDLNTFKEKLNKYTKLVSRDEAWKHVPEKFQGKTSFNMAEYDELKVAVPHLVRDTGADILDIIFVSSILSCALLSLVKYFLASPCIVDIELLPPTIFPSFTTIT
jgi:hypothetical protein